jgi:CubicO group peptidase (beta-lactamase class C family)
VSFKRLNEYLLSCTTDKRVAGLVCWIGSSRKTYFFEAKGFAQILPSKIKINKNTIFDLASLTKPLATALSIMLLHEKKHLRLDAKVKQYLPGAASSSVGKKTIKQLLTHTAGVPAWYPLYMLPEEEMIPYLFRSASDKKNVVYSCLGFIILGMIIEKISGQNLDDFCRLHLYRPLGLRNTMFGPIRKKNVAATEFGNKYEQRNAAQFGKGRKIKWRNYVIKGEVHDGNSFYAFNGISGNAGLFSNTLETVKILRALIAGNIISKKNMSMMVKAYTPGKDRRGLGWIIDPFPGYVSKNSFYHTGFTGTMCLVDPVKDLIVVFLTNAVHPVVRKEVMPAVRQYLIESIPASTKG